MTDFTALDNPIFNALTGPHASLAQKAGLAMRYLPDVAPFAALRDSSLEAFADLRTLLGPKDGVAFVTTEPHAIPDGWQVLRDRPIEQMVCADAPAPISVQPLVLGDADLPDLLALTAATEPGPFAAQTIRMGKYIGLRNADGRLMAMAGQRLSLADFTEISAVCTDPEFRGKGYARDLVVTLMREVFAAGKVPFLHVKNENGAKVVYEKIGFRVRREIQFTVIAKG